MVIKPTPVTQTKKTATPEGTVGPLPQNQPPASATLDYIKVNYSYTNDLITSLYHLYGTFLNHFVTVTITNSNSKPVKVVIRSEVSGYTNQASDTVDVPANDKKIIYQDPMLMQDMIDKLNSQKPGSFHILVVYLDQGVEKEILDQKGL